MRPKNWMPALFALLCMGAVSAEAQVVIWGPAPRVVYRPIAPPSIVLQAPVISYSPLLPAPQIFSGPQIVAPAPVISYYNPAPVVVGPPVIQAPVIVARPRGVIVRPKVYVRGRPIRNFFRAITP